MGLISKDFVMGAICKADLEINAYVGVCEWRLERKEMIRVHRNKKV